MEHRVNTVFNSIITIYCTILCKGCHSPTGDYSADPVRGGGGREVARGAHILFPPAARAAPVSSVRGAFGRLGSSELSAAKVRVRRQWRRGSSREWARQRAGHLCGWHWRRSGDDARHACWRGWAGAERRNGRAARARPLRVHAAHAALPLVLTCASAQQRALRAAAPPPLPYATQWLMTHSWVM